MSLPPELEAAIIAAPDEAAPYLVAADWLSSRGDPQGELVMLATELEQETNPARFLAHKHRREALLAAHGERWLNGASLDQAHWRHGFVAHARLQAEHLDAFLAAPAARFVRELEVEGPLEQLAAAFTRGAPPVLRGLALRGRAPSPALALATVLASVPQVTRLAVFGAECDFTHADPSPLVDLRLRDVRHPSLTPFLARAPLPQVATLELLVDAPLELKAAAVQRAPALRELRLEDDLADDLAQWAAQATVMRQLDALGLSGPMTDRGLDALLLESARLHRLTLSLEGGAFSGSLRRLAYRQLPKVTFHKTRAATEWYHPPSGSR